MKILSLNVWYGAQKEKLRDFLAAQIDDIDVFCLQETAKQADAIIDELFGDERFVIVRAQKLVPPRLMSGTF